MSSIVEATITSRLHWDQKTNQQLSQTPSHSYNYTNDSVDDNYQLMLTQGTGQGQVNQVWYDTIDLIPGYNSINLSSLILQTFNNSVDINFNGGNIKAIVIKNLSSTYGKITLPFSKDGSIFSGANQLEPSGKLVITNADGWKTTPNEKIVFNFIFPTTIKVSLIGSIYSSTFGGTVVGTSTEQAQLSVSGLGFAGTTNIHGNLIDPTCSINKFVNSVAKCNTSVTHGTISSSPILSGSTQITSTIIDISSTQHGHTALSIFGIPGTKVGTLATTEVTTTNLQRLAFVDSISKSITTVSTTLITKKTLGGIIEGYSSTSSPPLVHILPTGNSQIDGAVSGNIKTDKFVNSNIHSQTNIQVSLSNDATLGGLCEGHSSESASLSTLLDISGVTSISGHVTIPSVKTNKFVNTTIKSSTDVGTTDLINIKGLGGRVDGVSSTSTGLLYTDIYLSAKSQNLHNNLLSFYRFEEEIGTRYDSISNNDLLAYNLSQPERKYGVAGYSVGFSGVTTSGLYIVSGGNFTFETSNFTMAAWVKPVRQSGMEVIVSRFGTAPEDRSYEIVVTNANTARFSCYGPTINSTAIVSGMSINEWNLIVAWRDYDNDTIGITVNNNLIQETGFDESLNSSNENFQLGGYYYSLLGLYGDIDLFSVWDRVLDNDEKTLLWNDNYGWNTSLNTVETKGDTYLHGITTNLTSNLFSFWKFNEISGERANSSEKSYHLSDNLGVSYSPIQGKPGRCIKFAGITDQVLSNDSSDFSFGGTDFSMSCWVQFTGDFLSDQIFIGKYDTSGPLREYCFQLTTVPDLIFNKSTNGLYQSDNAVRSSVPIITGEWYHVVGIHDATNNEMSIVVNNTTDSKTMGSSTIGSYSAPFVIGGNGSKDAHLLKGRMDSAALWTRTLTPNDVTHLYNKGDGWDDIGTYSILSDVPQLSGTINGVSDTSTPTLDLSMLFSGTITGTSITSASLDWIGTTHSLIGTIIGTSTESATLGVATAHSLSGTINGISTEDGILDWTGTTHTLSGTINGISTESATLDLTGNTRTLSGIIIGTSTESATLDINSLLDGTIIGISTESATLDWAGTTHTLSGTVIGISTESATLDWAGTTHTLSGTVIGISTESATLDWVGTTHSLEGVINGISSVELAILGWVGTTHTLNGIISSISSFNAAVLDREGTTHALNGSFVGTSSISDAVLSREGTTHSLGGSFSGSSSSSSALLDSAGTTHILSGGFSGSGYGDTAILDVYVPSS